MYRVGICSRILEAVGRERDLGVGAAREDRHALASEFKRLEPDICSHLNSHDTSPGFAAAWMASSDASVASSGRSRRPSVTN